MKKTAKQCDALFKEAKKMIYGRTAAAEVEYNYKIYKDEKNHVISRQIEIYPKQENGSIYLAAEISSFCMYHKLSWYITYDVERKLPVVKITLI